MLSERNQRVIVERDAGVAMRTLQEWMGHKHISTTQRYADYAPGDGEAGLIAQAFAERGDNLATIPADLTAPHGTQPPVKPGELG